MDGRVSLWVLGQAGLLLDCSYEGLKNWIVGLIPDISTDHSQWAHFWGMDKQVSQDDCSQTMTGSGWPSYKIISGSAVELNWRACLRCTEQCVFPKVLDGQEPWLRGAEAGPWATSGSTDGTKFHGLVTQDMDSQWFLPAPYHKVLVAALKPNGKITESTGGQGYFSICNQGHGW